MLLHAGCDRKNTELAEDSREIKRIERDLETSREKIHRVKRKRSGITEESAGTSARKL